MGDGVQTELNERTNRPLVQRNSVGDILGLQVAVVSNKGLLQDLFIPFDSDGIHKVTCGNGKDTLLSFQKSGHQWTARCGAHAAFTDSSVQEQSEAVVLSNCSLYHLAGIDDGYYLYTEEVNKDSGIRHNYAVEKQRPITIGRAGDCGIMIKNDYISRHHAVLSWDDKGWTVRDTNSTNGVFVNNHKVQEAVLNYGDSVFMMGLRIVVGYGFISVNDGNRRAMIQSPYIHMMAADKDIAYTNPQKGNSTVDAEAFNRLPRERELIKAEPIVFDNPPPSMNGNQIPFLLRMGSPALMGGRALMTGNYFMAATSMIMPFLTQGFSEKERKEYEKQRNEKYRAYLDAKRDQISKECLEEKRILENTYPETGTIAAWPESKRRLWERRNVDDDFLTVRIGRGDYPMLAPYDCDEERFNIDEDELEKEMRSITSEPAWLKNAPVLMSLTKDYVCGVLGSKEQIRDFVQNMMLQIMLTHSPDEVKMMLLCDETEVKYYEQFRFQKHMRDDNFNVRFVATNIAEAARLSGYLSEQIEDSIGKKTELQKILKEKPFFVVVALDKKLYDAVEAMKDVLKQDDCIGVAVVAGFPELPKECTKVFQLKPSQNMTTYIKEPDHYRELFTVDRIEEQKKTRALMRMASINLPSGSAAYLLPKTVTFLEMFGVGKVEHLAPLRRWAENNPVKSLAVPVGVGTDGEVFTLDLHQKRQGPHGLVAGTTGSGKSEFLITYILSLAVNFSPKEVAFLLIDYKGGGLAGAFYDDQQKLYLPHVIGTITNLDGAAIQRSLISINAELKRRQRVLNEAKSITNAGTMDIYDYQRLYRAGRLPKPMPHLFIISDEFAELKAQQPEFLNELISTARIGRSLGVHLILATQKPAGVVNDQIVSNTKFRVCLRVADKADSMDMLKRPEAAELRDTGRFYLQVGNNEYFALGQSAWCGAAYEPSEEPPKSIDESISVIDPTGQAVLTLKPEVKKAKTEIKQLVATVKMLAETAQHEGISMQRLWMDPLESKVSIEDMERTEQELPPFTVLAGIIDDPEHQTRHTLTINLLKSKNIFILGESGSGKTMFLKTILYGVMHNYSPQEISFYIMDLSGRSLTAFRKAPHCGAALHDENEADFDRLLSMLRDTIDERKKLFEQIGVADYESYLAAKDHIAQQLPLILVVIDNFAGLTNFKKGNDYQYNFNQYLKEGLSYGIRYIITATHGNEVNTRAKQELTTRFALQLKDKYEYGEALNTRCTYTPPVVPGRGMCMFNDAPLEFQVATLRPDDTAREANALIQSMSERIAAQYPAEEHAAELPVVQEEQEYEQFCAGIPNNRIPLGYSMKDAKKISIPLKQAGFLSVYFGNPDGKKKILQNFLHAFRRTHGSVIFIAAENGSVASGTDSILQDYPYAHQIITCRDGAGKEIVAALIQAVEERKPIRNRYCEEHGLEQSALPSLAEAEDTIRAETDPVFVLIESFLSFTKYTKDEELVLKTVFEIARFYNILFIGCYNPDDTGKLFANTLQNAFNPDKNVILFGGKTDKQNLIAVDSKSTIKEVLPKFGRGLMGYRGKTYTITMPCGEEQVEVSEDEASIF